MAIYAERPGEFFLARPVSSAFWNCYNNQAAPAPRAVILYSKPCSGRVPFVYEGCMAVGRILGRERVEVTLLDEYRRGAHAEPPAQSRVMMGLKLGGDNIRFTPEQLELKGKGRRYRPRIDYGFDVRLTPRRVDGELIVEAKGTGKLKALAEEMKILMEVYLSQVQRRLLTAGEQE